MRFCGICGANQSEIRAIFGLNLCEIRANLAIFDKIHGKIHANQTRI